MRTHLCIPALLLIALSLPATAQYTVKRIVFQGQTPYTQADLEAASGLKPGQSLSNADLQTAAQKLGESGAFDDMQATLDGPMKSINVVFKLKAVDPSKLLRVSLANFVWWSPDDLKKEINKRVPLTGETVPDAGTLQDSVKAALEALLVEKGVNGAKVSEEVLEPRPGTPYRVAAYRIDSPQILLGGLKVDGASTEMQAVIAKRATEMVGRAYNEDFRGQNLADSVQSMFLDTGHLEAQLTPLQRSLSGTNPVKVMLSTSVNEGPVYKVSSFTWSGSPVMSAQDFNALAKIQPGMIASQAVMREALAHIQDAYHAQGYIDVTVDAPPVLDRSSHTAAFVVQVTPGDVYHVQEVQVIGLTPAQKKVWDADWKLKPGDAYDALADEVFLKKHIGSPPFEGSNAAFKTLTDTNTKTVVLQVVFQKR